MTAAVTTTSGAHQKRVSASSVDEKPSGDEHKKDGISAKPKRVSLAPSTSSERAATTVKSVSTTPARRATIQPSTVRRGTTSPVSARATPATPGVRSTTLAGTRLKPLSSSASRNVAAPTERKRLSTIPASPAVKTDVEESEDNKENVLSPVPEKAAEQHALEPRKPTQLLLIEHRIHEFELVHTMLQAAMASDGINDEEQEALDTEAANAIAKLHSDLTRVREFERTHGRLPTEAELDEARSVQIEDTKMQEEVKASSDTAAVNGVSELQDDLVQSRAQGAALQAQLDDLKAKMAQIAEEHSVKTGEAEEVLRKEHATKTEELLQAHEQRIEELSVAHQAELDGLSASHNSEIEAIHAEARSNLSGKEAELGRLQSQIEELRSDNVQKLEELQAAHLQELSNKDTNNQAEVSNLREAHKKVLEDTAGEMSRQAQVLQKIQRSKVEELENQNATVRQLQDEVTSLKEEKAREAADAADTLASAEKTYLGRIQKVEEELRAAQEELQKATTLHQAQHEEALRAQEELASARSELETNQTANAQSLQELADLQKWRDDAAARETAHERELSSLLSQLKTVKVEHQQTSARYEEQINQYELNASTAAKDLAAMRSMHEHEIEQSRSELNARHEDTLASVQKTHAEQIQHLELQANSALQAHEKQLKQAKEDASLSHQKALDELRASHAQQIQDLERQVGELQAELESSQLTHAKHVEETERQKLDQDLAINSLKESHAEAIKLSEARVKSIANELGAARAGHDEKLQQIESQEANHAKQLEEASARAKAAQDEALDELRSSLIEETRQLESKLRSTEADLEGARFQMQTLKGILQSVEEESRAKDEEHANALEKVEEEVETSVKKLAEQAAQMMNLQVHHETALADAKAALETQSNETIGTLRKEHETALAELRATLEEQHKEAIEKLRVEHEQVLSSSKDAAQSQHGDLEKRLKADHESKLEELRKELDEKHQAEVAELSQQHDSASARLAESVKQHSEALQRANEEHDGVVKKIEADLQQAREQAQDKSEIGELRSQLARLEAQLAQAQEAAEESQNKHSESMAAATAERENALELVRSELDATRQAAEQRPTASELEELSKKAQKSTADLQEQHARAIREVKAEHEAHLDKVLRDLEEAQRASQQPQDSGELDNVKHALEDAKKTIFQLQEELHGAILEVETQRSLAETAQNEVEELKKGEVVALSSLDAPSTSKSPKSSSPKPGLESSRWAAPETGEDAGTTVKQDPRSDEGSTASAPALDPQPGAKTKNVAGQLAGIQEEIKQLDEISDEFLEGHERMARTLNQVDDRAATSGNLDEE